MRYLFVFAMILPWALTFPGVQAEDLPVPPVLSAFTHEDGGVYLNWTVLTHSSSDISHFILNRTEPSGDSVEWTLPSTDREFFDSEDVPLTTIYRIQVITVDGSVVTSNPASPLPGPFCPPISLDPPDIYWNCL